MSGPLPIEVFKILPVVQGGVRGGGRGTYVKLMDNCFYKCATVVIENNICWRVCILRTPAVGPRQRKEDGVK